MVPRCTGVRRVGDRPRRGGQLSYRFGSPQPGDVIVRGTAVERGYKSIRSHNVAVRWVQNALSFIGLRASRRERPDRVIAVGGQTVHRRSATGLTVNGRPLKEPYLLATMMADLSIYPCLGSGVRAGHRPARACLRMGDNCTHSADSRDFTARCYVLTIRYWGLCWWPTSSVRPG